VKREGGFLVSIVLAFMACIAYVFICTGRGSVLKPVNIAITLFLFFYILAGCIIVLKNHYDISRRRIAFLVAGVVILVLVRYILFIPDVLDFLGTNLYMGFGVLHVILQLVVGALFLRGLKRIEQPKCS